MKIVEIIPFLYPVGGAERLVCDLVRFGSFKQDTQILIISLYNRPNAEFVKSISGNNNVTIEYLNKKKGIDLRCSKQLKKLIEAFNPDVIHCHLDSLVAVWLSKVFKKYRTYYTVHTLINKKTMGSHLKFKNLLYGYLFKKQLIKPIAISNIIKKSICLFFKLPNEVVAIAKNGVPLDKFSNPLTLLQREYDFIFIGRFIETKNPLIVLKSFANVCQYFRNARIAMLGNGPLLNACKGFVRDNNLSRNVTFTDFVDDISEYIKNSKILLLPSVYEGNPMVINEAIASKCFVIATNVGGIPDIIDNESGILINMSDDLCFDLERTMKDCLGKIALLDKTLAKSYEKNKQKVSIEKTYIEYLRIFGE